MEKLRQRGDCGSQGRGPGRIPGRAAPGADVETRPLTCYLHPQVQAINVSSRFEEEIKAEQEERKKQAEEVKQRKAAFKELQSTFK